MKKIRFSTTLLLVSGLTGVGSAHAATATTTLDVSATVGLVCSVSSSPVNFGVVDPLVGATTTGGVSVTCPAGTPYDIALDAGLNFTGAWRAISDGVNSLEYGLYDPATGQEWSDVGYAGTYPFGGPVPGTGTGTATNYVINADLMAAAAAVPDGLYTDVVNVTIQY